MEMKCTIGWALWKRLEMRSEGSDYSSEAKTSTALLSTSLRCWSSTSAVNYCRWRRHFREEEDYSLIPCNYDWKGAETT
ncbi:hypothetical protein A2U01_0031295 [Trifolium medium]|uniref:Uncharacterized protein n=1 Tax=Trifolium medium TaxID=97028 RepID=A0A392PDL5_9FABA|nr:hypothetical protein [Trifolium medium]